MRLVSGMRLDKLQEAFKDWQDTFPGSRPGLSEHMCCSVDMRKSKIFKIPSNWDGDCQCPGGSSHHSYYVRNRAAGTETRITRPDDEVCPRERAWRRYVKIRDGK